MLFFSLFTPAIGATNSSTVKNVQVDERIMQLKQLVAEQEEQLGRTQVIDEVLLDATGKVNVIVQLSEPPVALEQGKSELAGKVFTSSQANNVLKKVTTQQATFEKELNLKKVNYQKGFTYNQVFNGFSMTVDASELDEILAIPGVVSISVDEERHALEAIPSREGTVGAFMEDSTPHLGVPTLWDMGIDGAGVKVAVLDTGIDYHHPAFEDVYKGGFNFVPHTGNDYARARANDDGYETSPKDRPAHRPEFNTNGSSFYTTHGTHVAGTIVHLAPKVDLYSYRVLGAYGSGSNAGIIAAIEKSVVEGMDIINLSLGGGSNSQTAPDAIAINNATLAGVTAVIATGNSGPNRGTIGNPASSAFAISVGNSTLPETHLQSVVTVEANEYTNTSSLPMMGWKYGANPSEVLTGTHEVVSIPGVGRPGDFTGIDVEGKVALISRGDIPFVDKIAAAREAGAIATIIHNNQAGAGPAGVFLGNSFDFIPTFDMSTAEGNALRTALGTGTGEVTFGEYTATTTKGDEINNSSSRGPSTPTFDIKPDVVAPGTNIMSAVPAYLRDFPEADYSKSFARYTGTSMATPHVAGVAALLKQLKPEWTPFDIKVALSNTAKQLDVTKYDVFAQGPGRVQPVNAALAEALAYSYDSTVFNNQTHENVKGTVTFGKVEPNANAAKQITRQIVVKNVSGNTNDYNVSVQVTKNATGAMSSANVEVDVTSFTLTDEQLITVTLNVPAGTTTGVNELLGYIHIQSDSTKLLLPFAAELSPQVLSGLKHYYMEHPALSPNGDGVRDTSRLLLSVHNRHNTYYIELWDPLDPTGGEFGDGYIGYLAQGTSLNTGNLALTLNGTYRDWADGSLKTVPDGVYTIDLTAVNPLGGTTFAWDVVYVKRTKAEVELNVEMDNSEAELTGTIIDSFVNYKETVEDMIGLPYDVNEMLSVEYDVLNAEGNKIGSDKVTLEQDGTFSISLSDLDVGKNTLTLSVVDIAGNSSKHSISLEVDGPSVESPNYDEAVFYESVGNFYNAVYYAGQAIADGDNRATELMNSVAEVLLAEADALLADGDFTNAEYSYQLLVETVGVPQSIKDAAASKIAVKSEEFGIALFYETVSNYFNAVYYAGQAIAAGDLRVDWFMAQVAEKLFEQADADFSSGNFDEALDAYALLASTTGVPAEIKEAAASKLFDKSEHYDVALWYAEVNLYNAVHYLGLAFAEGDLRASITMETVAQALLVQADADLADGNYLSAVYAYILLVETDGVPQHIKDAASSRLMN